MNLEKNKKLDYRPIVALSCYTGAVAIANIAWIIAFKIPNPALVC